MTNIVYCRPCHVQARYLPLFGFAVLKSTGSHPHVFENLMQIVGLMSLPKPHLTFSLCCCFAMLFHSSHLFPYWILLVLDPCQHQIMAIAQVRNIKFMAVTLQKDESFAVAFELCSKCLLAFARENARTCLTLIDQIANRGPISLWKLPHSNACLACVIQEAMTLTLRGLRLFPNHPSSK